MSTSSARAARHSGAFKVTAGIAATAVAGLAITAGGVYALLRAQAFNSTAEVVNTGTLSLTLGSNLTSVGFGQTITAMAPGDVVNRYVSLTNAAGTNAVDGKNLVLQLSDQSAPTALTLDAAKGLQVTVQSCTAPWTVTSASCTGGTQGSAIALPAATFTTAPQTLVAGAFPAGTTLYYKVGVSLPSSVTETVTNGTPPVGSVQGLASSLRWTFSIDQCDPVTTSN
jgi:spore coat-associated protein N